MGHIRINPSERILFEIAGVILLREYFGLKRTFFQRIPTNGTLLHSAGSHSHILESQETALFVLGDFWLLLVDLFSVFTASPCVSVGFPPAIRGALS